MNQKAPQRPDPAKQVMPQKSAPPAPAAPPSPPSPPVEGDTVTGPAGTLTLDFTGVSTDFEPLPVGNYGAVVSEVEHVPQSAKSGAPYLKFTFEVTEEGFSGRKLFLNTSLQPNALWKLGKTLEALGVPIPDGAFELDLAVLCGLPCTLAVSTRTYQQKLRNDITEVLPAASGPTAPPFPG